MEWREVRLSDLLVSKGWKDIDGAGIRSLEEIQGRCVLQGSPNQLSITGLKAMQRQPRTNIPLP